MQCRLCSHALSYVPLAFHIEPPAIPVADAGPAPTNSP
jgi:hypothetical protein